MMIPPNLFEDIKWDCEDERVANFIDKTAITFIDFLDKAFNEFSVEVEKLGKNETPCVDNNLKAVMNQMQDIKDQFAKNKGVFKQQLVDLFAVEVACYDTLNRSLPYLDQIPKIDDDDLDGIDWGDIYATNLVSQDEKLKQFIKTLEELSHWEDVLTDADKLVLMALGLGMFYDMDMSSPEKIKEFCRCNLEANSTLQYLVNPKLAKAMVFKEKNFAGTPIAKATYTLLASAEPIEFYAEKLENAPKAKRYRSQMEDIRDTWNGFVEDSKNSLELIAEYNGKVQAALECLEHEEQTEELVKKLNKNVSKLMHLLEAPLVSVFGSRCWSVALLHAATRPDKEAYARLIRERHFPIPEPDFVEIDLKKLEAEIEAMGEEEAESKSVESTPEEKNESEESAEQVVSEKVDGEQSTQHE